MDSRMFLLASTCLLGIGLRAGVLAAEPEPKPLTLQQCPAAVQQTLQRESRDGAIVEISALESAGGPVYVAAVKQGGREYDLEIRGSGVLVMKGLAILEEGPVKPAELPAPVRATLEREAHGGTVGATVTRHNPQLGAGQAGPREFVGVVTIGGLDYQVEVRDDGVLLAKTLATKEEPRRTP